MAELPKYRSPAKNKLIEFIFATRDSDEKEWEFSVEGNKEFAESFVHRMRVELSRLRKKNERKGNVNRPFKILLISLTELPGGRTKIVLKKSMEGHQIYDAVAEIFSDLLSIGAKPNG